MIQVEELDFVTKISASTTQNMDSENKKSESFSNKRIEIENPTIKSTSTQFEQHNPNANGDDYNSFKKENSNEIEHHYNFFKKRISSTT